MPAAAPDVKKLDLKQLTPFANEPYTDFNQPENAAKMRAALKQVHAQFGKEYKLVVAGKRRSASSASARFDSLNPSKPSEVVGIHQEASESGRRRCGRRRLSLLSAMGGAAD